MTMARLAELGWFHLFSGYLFKSTVVLTLALVLVLLFRRRSASLRHFVLSLSLAGLLLLPVISYVGLGWETSLLPAANWERAIVPTVHVSAVPFGQISGKIEKEGIVLPHLGSTLTPAKSLSLERAHVKKVPAGLLFKSLLPTFWFAGLVVLLLRLAAGIVGAFRLTRQGETVSDSRWRILMEGFLVVLHLRRRVRLKSHREVLVPLTWGFIKPVVLIPRNHGDWSEEQRSSALVHELWHVKRADFLVMVLVRLSLAVFWFNPLSWVVFRRLKNEQEEACDELVLKTGIKPSTYAANLLFFKSTAGTRLSHFAALLGLFGFGKSAFNERLAAILKQKWTFKEVTMKTKILLSSAVILVLTLIGMARPSTPADGDAEAVFDALIAPGPSVLEKTYGWASPVVQETERSQEQSQAEEKKAQEKKQQEQARAQEKQEQEKQVQAQEKQEQKEHKKEAVVWTIKEGEKHKYQIRIQEGDKIKTIVVGKPIIIKEADGKKVICITPEGEEVKLVEGKPVHVEIVGGKLEVIKEGKILEVGEDGSSFYVSVKPDIDISETVKVALKDLPDINKSVAIALKDLPVTIKTLDIAKPYITWVGSQDQEELREKLREVREKLKAVEEKKMELREVDEALADLEKDLEKMNQEIATIGVKLEDKAVAYKIAKKVSEAEAHAEVRVDIAEDAKKDTVKVIVSKDGMFELVYLTDAGEKGREAYERIVARLKKDLPEGFTLESEFDEESGRVTLKVSGPGGKETPKELVKKITDSIRDETKEKKE